MSSKVTRRQLLATAGTAALTPASFAMQDQERPPALPDSVVQKFVGVSHSDFDAVKELHAEHPTVLNAVWDWTNGDFESAIGAAGHTGRREICEYLIENGARTDLFVHTMLGHMDIVKPVLTRYPQMLHCKGPHGISLIRHAEVGQEPAAELLDYLKTLEKLA